MKRILIILLLFVASQLFAQYWPGKALKESDVYTVVIDTATYEILYVMLPTLSDPVYMDTSFTNIQAKSGPVMVWASGDGDLFVQPNMIDGGTDSLALWIKPIKWDTKEKKFVLIENDSTNLVLDTPDVYTSATKDLLDWTSGQEYHCVLSGLLWATPGFALFIYEEGKTAGTVDISITLMQEF